MISAGPRRRAKNSRSRNGSRTECASSGDASQRSSSAAPPGEVMHLAIAEVGLGDDLDGNQVVLRQLGEKAVDLGLVSHPELADTSVEVRLEVVAGARGCGKEAEDRLAERPGASTWHMEYVRKVLLDRMGVDPF